MDRVTKRIRATKHLDVLVWENRQGTSGYITIKHNARVSDTDNEVIVDTPDVPDLVKALTSAALELSLKGALAAGFKEGLHEGWGKKSEDFTKHLEHYLATGGSVDSLLATAKAIHGHMN